MEHFDNRQDEANEQLREFGVEPNEACPKCGERDIDKLTWDEFSETVQCDCGTVYTPGEPTE